MPSVKLLGAFAKLLKAIIIFVMSVCLSDSPPAGPPAYNNSAPTARNFMTFDISAFLENLSRNLQDSLKYDKNDGYFI
jgi:hypothetical protein